MTDTEIIKAVAELDGIKYVAGRYSCTCNVDNDGNAHYPSCKIGKPRTKTKPYLTSRDAIVPVVEKQSVTIQHKVFHELCCMNLGTTGCFLFSAKQLCEALLKAVGKYKD